jgi:hypothetical protein
MIRIEPWQIEIWQIEISGWIDGGFWPDWGLR